MPIKEYKVEPLFAEPVFRASIAHAISPEQEEYIKNLKMVENRDNFISEDLYIFEHPELASIKEAVQEVLDIYASEVMGINQRLYVTQSWSLLNHPNSGMHGHSHSNSVISGSLYYTKLPDPVPSMIFDKHRGYQQLELRPEQSRQNIYNTLLNIVTPVENDVVLFSSGLQHYVEKNSTNEPRHAIAFNTFIQGKFGNYRDVSELAIAPTTD
jgi:uncharacterized protein (TIGR02466 family)